MCIIYMVLFETERLDNINSKDSYVSFMWSCLKWNALITLMTAMHHIYIYTLYMVLVETALMALMTAVYHVCLVLLLSCVHRIIQFVLKITLFKYDHKLFLMIFIHM